MLLESDDDADDNDDDDDEGHDDQDVHDTSACYMRLMMVLMIMMMMMMMMTRVMVIRIYIKLMTAVHPHRALKLSVCARLHAFRSPLTSCYFETTIVILIASATRNTLKCLKIQKFSNVLSPCLILRR